MAKIDNKKTTAREAVTCVALSYFANNSNVNIEEFSKIIRDYYFDNEDTEIKKLSNKLPKSFSFERVKDLCISKGKSTALKASGSGNSYGMSHYKKDFPNGKPHSSEDGGPTNLDAEIKSAYSTAKAIATNPVCSDLSQYMIVDQASNFMKVVKDDCLNKTLKALKLPSSIGSDILSSIDIILVRVAQLSSIMAEFKEHIADADDMTILNNLAYGTTGKNTFRTLTNNHFSKKNMIGISLKKVPANRKANLKVVGLSGTGKEKLKLYLDPYTEFLAKVELLKTRTELFNLIDDMVEIVKIGNTDPRAYFAVDYKLNYKNVNITDKIEKITLQIGRSGFNAASPDQLGFVGAASYKVTLPILKRYPRYNQMVRQVVNIRKKAFDHAVEKTNVPNNLSSDYQKAKNMVGKSELVLYDKKDNIVIRDFCKKYDNVSGTKDSFQTYRIGVSKLCKGKSLESPDGLLKNLNTTELNVTGASFGPKGSSVTTLQNDYVHSQGLWMYTRENQNLKKFFKKQISLTLYGLMSKKGAKVFYSNSNPKSGMITENAFVKEFKTKNNRTKLAKVTQAPFVLIS